MITFKHPDGVVIEDADPRPAPTRLIAIDNTDGLQTSLILQALSNRQDDTAVPEPPQGRVEFVTATSLNALPALGIVLSHTDAVLIYDPTLTSRRFKIDLGDNCAFIVKLGPPAFMASPIVTDVCLQLWSIFTKNFATSLEEGTLPRPPQIVQLPDMDHLLARLLGGPHFGSQVHEAYANVFPPDWPLSYGRISPSALDGNSDALQKLVGGAFDAFERACLLLMAQDPRVRELIAAGVEAPSQEMLKAYLRNSGPLKVRRLDMVIGPNVISENDEMPGGFPDAYHNDDSYGINAARWAAALEALFAAGPVVFLVSTEWSKVYLRGLKWFAEHLQELGYPAYFLPTDDAEQLVIQADGVFLDGLAISTIWRQFPIFEATGHVAQLVLASQTGIVDMVPQYTHLANKTWLAVFWAYQDFFQAVLSPEVFKLLQSSIPYTEVAINTGDFPRTMRLEDGSVHKILTFDELVGLPKRLRQQLVVKVGGANTHSARMYGVIVGRGISTSKWQEGLREIVSYGTPIILQQFHEPCSSELAVLSVLDGERRAELVSMRGLGRPWSIFGKLTTMTVYAVPGTMRLHGTTHSCQVPTRLP